MTRILLLTIMTFVLSERAIPQTTYAPTQTLEASPTYTSSNATLIQGRSLGGAWYVVSSVDSEGKRDSSARSYDLELKDNRFVVTSVLKGESSVDTWIFDGIEHTTQTEESKATKKKTARWDGEVLETKDDTVSCVYKDCRPYSGNRKTMHVIQTNRWSLSDNDQTLLLTRLLVIIDDTNGSIFRRLSQTETAKRTPSEISPKANRVEGTSEAEVSNITAIQDGRTLSLKRVQGISIGEGDWANGITIRSGTSVLTYRGTTVGAPGSAYAQDPLAADQGWYPIESFTVVEVETGKPQSVMIRNGERSYPAAFIVKRSSTQVLVVIPKGLIPCTLEVNR